MSAANRITLKARSASASCLDFDRSASVSDNVANRFPLVTSQTCDLLSMVARFEFFWIDGRVEVRAAQIALESTGPVAK